MPEIASNHRTQNELFTTLPEPTALSPKGRLWAGGSLVNNSLARGAGRSRKDNMPEGNEPPAGYRAGRKVDAAFRRRAIELSERGDRTVKEVARALGISEHALYRWRVEYGVAAPQGMAELTSTPRSMPELERENRALRLKLAEMEEREQILKKSLGILSPPIRGMPKWKV